VISVADLKTTVNAAVPYTYYQNEFPATAADDAAYVRIFGGFAPSQWTNKRRPSFQVVVRGKNGPAVEAKAWAIYKAFNGRTNYVIGTQKISSSFADQSAPLYIGLDANNRPMYSVNFTMTYIDGQTM